MTTIARNEGSFLHRLREDSPLVGVELRPPPADMDRAESIDTWIDLHHTIRNLSLRDTAVFLTDDAVGEREEENLRHASINLVGDVRRSRIVPFLTCKHSLEYCLLHATRAASEGIGALTVLGGDRTVGPPRCVEHAYILRRKIRERVPSLDLGGWANPHRDPAEQVDYLLDDEFTAEFYLTQVVSHHRMEVVDAFLEETARREVPFPALFGVFYYRSANPDTLERLSRFLPVPAEEITREFEAGGSAEEICARTIRALRSRGVDKVYVANFGFRRATERLERVVEAVEGHG